MDISTVSRVTNGKYAQLPWEIKELKTFFSEGIETVSGKAVSNTKVKSPTKGSTVVCNAPLVRGVWRPRQVDADYALPGFCDLHMAIQNRWRFSIEPAKNEPSPTIDSI